MPTQLQLLGAASVQHGGERFDLPAPRVAALLCYLAYQGGWVERDALAALLWPEIPGGNARSNLRKVLNRARDLPYAEGLEAERQRLRWPVASDVAAFREALAGGRAAQALQLYRGRLLERSGFDDLPGVRTWLEQERAALHLRWRDLVLRRVEELARAGDHGAAGALLRRLLDDDPLDEDALQAYLRTASARRDGDDRDDALARFERFRGGLGERLGLEPLNATVALADALGTAPGDATLPVSAPSGATGAWPPLPRETTPFIPRPDELARIHALLDDDACRLLTLVGPGGTGKTRLALRVGHERRARGEAVCAVALADVETLSGLVARIAAGVGAASAGSGAERQLLRYLADKRLRILLDDLDRLADASAWLATLLERAPRVRLLTTSREALRLRSEWLFEVGGMSYPRRDVDADPRKHEALRLFLRTADRFGATLRPDEVRTAARICRAVEGSPLAVELAASWVRALTVDEIEAELTRDLDFLAGGGHDRPARQRSIRAVFDGSWRRLAPPQQRVLAGLAVFRGGFERAAAGEVAGAGPRDLLELVGRSLLRRRDDGRFDLHPLLRRYADERLHESGAADAIRRRHADVYLTLLREHARALTGAGQIDALERLQSEYDNVVAAWRGAVAAGREEAVTAAAQPLFVFYRVANRYREGADAFRHAAARLEAGGAAGPALARVRARWGALLARIGEFEMAERTLEACLTGSPEAPDAPAGRERAFCLENLGAYVRYWLGDVEAARAHVREAHDLYRDAGASHGVARTLFQLGVFARHEGRYDEARRALAESLHAFEREGDRRWEGTCRATLGVVLFELGDLASAETLLRQGIERLVATRQEQQAATSRSHLGMVMAARGDDRGSLEVFTEALATVERFGDKPWWLPEMLVHLGRAQLRLDDADAGHASLRRSLTAALELHAAGPTLHALLGFADALAPARRAAALALYRYVADHPGTVHADAEAARQRLRALEPSARELADAAQRYADHDLERVARQLLDDPPPAVG